VLARVLVSLFTSALAAASWAALPAQSSTECRVPGLRHAAQCGVVQRALNPAQPQGLQIDIHYVVAPALARRKLPDPVFLLAGGPGQSAIALAPSTLALLGRLNNRRDIVWVDQRGTGKSAPLKCPTPPRASLVEYADGEAPFKQLLACKTQLLALPYIQTPANLGFFTTSLAMQDLEAVRLKLGAARINLVGASYGTRAALEYARQFPQAVRRSVLDGVAPPDMVLPASFSTDNQAALDQWFASCEAQPACAGAYPGLRPAWRAWLARLPLEARALHPFTGQPQHFTLTREAVLATVRTALYNPMFASGLAAAISSALQGQYEGLMGLSALQTSRAAGELAMGMHFSVVCSEDLPWLHTATDMPGADFGREQAQLYQRACAHWPRGEVPAAYRTVLASAAPVLLLSGGLDPATPTRHGERVARLLGPTARHVALPYVGHGLMGLGCMRDVVYRFIDAETDAQAIAIDAQCAARMPQPAAFIPVSAPFAP
jgi:pimeloyl-ACP methyl ester carboxylesterase